MSQQPSKLDKTDARQGQSGLGVRYVLIAGLVLVVVAFVVVYAISRAHAPA